jgi:hypothetical protein
MAQTWRPSTCHGVGWRCVSVSTASQPFRQLANSFWSISIYFDLFQSISISLIYFNPLVQNMRFWCKNLVKTHWKIPFNCQFHSIRLISWQFWVVLDLAGKERVRKRDLALFVHMVSRDTQQKCHFTLGFCMLNFSIVGCPSIYVISIFLRISFLLGMRCN